MAAQFENSRKIIERLWVEGMLELQTPARFGGGEADDLLDMPLLLDAVQQRALLTGASIAGALRNYLRSREAGYNHAEDDGSLCTALFGRAQSTATGAHSLLMTHDALSETPARPETELRDGVAIDPSTRTAEHGKKFDIELLAAGTQFKLRFELFLTEDETKHASLLQALAIALQGFERGEIGLGARKRRGFGECKLAGDWTLLGYRTDEPKQLVAWLKRDQTQAKTNKSIAALLGVTDEKMALDGRHRFTLSATFGLQDSILIRSGSGEVNSPDAVHLHSRRDGEQVPVISGTTLAGALRARALRIVNTLGAKRGWESIEGIFGVREKPNGKGLKETERKLTSSRLIVREAVIKNAVAPEQVQQRVKIDRFTGGSFPTGLFSEQPALATNETEVKLHLELLGARDHEVGLLLLLLKDLWSGDLPVGGESSVGRGRLKGKEATLSYGSKGTWVITQSESKLNIVGDAEKLEGYVGKIAAWIQGEQHDH
jgi:CRISPR/Cas system CSM-associated protein Csm3 (group 7 of RAMP superfamily)